MTQRQSPEEAKPDVAILLRELAAIKNYLIATQDILASGYMPNITGMEIRVAVLCEQIQKACGDTKKKCAPELAELLSQLNDCDRAMRAFYDKKSNPERVHDKP